MPESKMENERWVGGMLVEKRCVACEGGVAKLEDATSKKLLVQVPEWGLSESGSEICRTFEFNNFYETMAFVNGVAWVANKENHHPDMRVSYQCCEVRFYTHAVGGLTENDFICAAKIDQLLA
jgi:4a-hydroxytetrahydrobiopterin dehydratase